MKHLLLDFTLDHGILCAIIRHEIINDREGFTIGYSQAEGWCFKYNWQRHGSFVYLKDKEWPSDKVESELAVFTTPFDAIILSLAISSLHEKLVAELSEALPLWQQVSAPMNSRVNRRLKKVSKKLILS